MNSFNLAKKDFFLVNIFSWLILFFISNFFFPELNFYFLFLIFFSLLLYFLKEVENFSTKLYNLFLISFYIKIILLFFVYKIGNNLNYEQGNIASSDSLQYFYGGIILHDILFNLDKFGISVEGFTTFFDSSYYVYNIIIHILVPDISLKQICYFNIFYITFSSIILFKILNKLKIDPKIIFILVIISLLDLKFVVFGFFNLKESLVNLLLITLVYQLIKIKKNNNTFFLIITFILFFLLILILKFYLAIVLALFLITYLFAIKFYNKYSLKNVFIVLILASSLFLILFNYYFYDEYEAIKSANIENIENSIGSKVANLNVLKNPFYVLIQLATGIIGIFPLYKIYTPFMELEKFAVIWFHVLLILSFMGVKEMFNKKIFNVHTFFIFGYVMLIFIISAVGSLGGLEFIRYSIFSHFALFFFAAYYLRSKIYSKIKKTLIFYLSINILLISIYLPLKYIYF